MVVNPSVSLTEDQDAHARGLVESGRFPRVSAVLQQGLMTLRERAASADALERAAARVRGIEDDIERLAEASQQGAICTDIAPDLRRVTKRSPILYFVADREARRIDVIAVFFDGQDHQRHMLARLLRE